MDANPRSLPARIKKRKKKENGTFRVGWKREGRLKHRANEGEFSSDKLRPACWRRIWADFPPRSTTIMRILGGGAEGQSRSPILEIDSRTITVVPGILQPALDWTPLEGVRGASFNGYDAREGYRE